jgi:hypothetical protein
MEQIGAQEGRGTDPDTIQPTKLKFTVLFAM